MDDRALHQDLVGLSQAVLAISAEHELDGVLQHIVHQARHLIGARYGALGVPDTAGERLERLLVSGMPTEQRQAIGDPPVGRGLLGVVLREGRAVRIPNIAADPRSVGFPANHPPMTSLLGVPIRRGAEVLGDLYLADKTGAVEFSEIDQALLEQLAEHAALAIVNAQLHGRLLRSEARYRTLTESAPEIVFAVDVGGHVTFMNDRVADVTGFPAASFVGLALRDMVVPEDRAQVDVNLAALRAGASRASFAVRARDAGGALRYYEVSLVPRADSAEGYQGIAQDVTERHALAREMAERNRELATTREEREALRSFVSLIIQAQEDERARIAGDLHDSTVQTLTAIARRLHSLAGSTGSGELAGDLTVLADAAQAEVDELRRLSRNLRPSVLDHLGLAAGLEQLAADLRRDGLDVTLVVSGEPGRLPDHARTALFRIAQEALTNVRRHAAAHTVEMRLLVAEGEALLDITDDGRGFAAPGVDHPRAGSSGLGLMGMHERAAMLGGALSVASTPGAGTRVTARLPL